MNILPSLAAIRDLTLDDARCTGFEGGFALNDALYLVSHTNLIVAKVNPYSLLVEAVLDLGTGMKGLLGAFTDGAKGYVLPHATGSFYGSTVARFDPATMAAADISLVDFSTLDPTLTGGNTGTFDGRSGYVEFQNAAVGTYAFGIFDTLNFTNAALRKISVPAPVPAAPQSKLFANGALYCLIVRGDYTREMLKVSPADGSILASVVLPGVGVPGTIRSGGAMFATADSLYVSPFQGLPLCRISWDLSLIDAFDATSASAKFTNFGGGVAVDGSGYFTPAAGTAVLQFDLQDISSYAACDLSYSDPSGTSYFGQIHHAGSLYMVPFSSGRIARLLIRDVGTLGGI